MKKLIEKIHQSYPELEIEKFFGKVAGGYLSDNYAVGNNQKKYFLRQYRSQYDEARVQSMHRVKKFFDENGIPIIPPIETSQGKTFFEFESRFYALFPFIEEKTIEASDLSERSIKSIGKMLAKIHLLSKNGFPNLTEERASEFDKEKCLKIGEEIKAIVDDIKNPTNFDKMAQKQVNYKIDLIKKNQIKFSDLGLKFDHIIHGDFHSLNLFYDENGEVKYVYDLEKAVVSPRSFEIARAVDYICLGEFGSENIKKAKIFIAAYRSVYPISSSEIRTGMLFWYLKNIHSFWIEEAHYLNNNFRTDVFYPIQDKKLKYYEKHFDQMIAEILEEKK